MKVWVPILGLIGTFVCTVICDDLSPNDIYQPCRSNINLECTRKFFGKNGHCTVVKAGNDVKSPFVDEYLPIYLPKINLTVIPKKGYFFDLNGEIEQFYMDRKTGNLVFSVNFKGLSCEAQETYYAVDQKGKEPRVYLDYVNATYVTVLTAVIPASNGITVKSLKEATYSAYISDVGKSNIVTGPKFSASTDPVVAKAYEGLLADVPTALLEIFRTKATYFFLAYLQKYICDYQLHPAVVVERYDPTVLANINEVNNDETSLSKPCDGNNDITACVIDYFKEKGTCTIVRKPNDRPYYREKFINYIPKYNLTAYPTKSIITGLDGNIEKFYINEKTGNLVMAVNFKNITSISKMSRFQINLRGKQPIVFTERVVSSYPVVLTAVIPTRQGLTRKSLEKAIVSAYFPDRIMGPHILGPAKATMFANMRSDGDTVQEAMVTEAKNYFQAYLQKYICNFGIPLN